MRILHAPQNIAGQATAISRGEKSLGYKSEVLIYNQDDFFNDYDINLNLNRYPALIQYPIIIINFLFCLLKYDIFHFHYAHSLLPFYIDIPILKLFKKKVYMQYWGSDIITTDIIRQYTLLTDDILNDVYPGINNEKKRKKIQGLNQSINQSIVGDYSLLPYSPDSIVIRQAIDLSELPFIGCDSDNAHILIVHAPSRRGLKGTKYILQVVEKLKKEEFPIELILVENTPHDKALEIFKKADIVIDDILMGPYGILAIECMSFGKPVLDHIHENLIPYYGDLPIVNTSPDTLYDNLKRLIMSAELRKELGRKGRKYVETNHDSKIIARKHLDLYYQ